MTTSAATDPFTRTFRIGDQVHVYGCTRKSTTWKIVADDTDCTPVHDPEPAYALTNGRVWRYAYQSALVPA